MESQHPTHAGKKQLKVIIHMGTTFLAEGSGFIDNVPNAKRMWTFMKAFISAGHSVCVIAPGEKKSVKRLETGAAYKTYRMIPNKGTNLSRLFSQISQAVNSLTASFGVGKADVVLSTSPPALLSPSGWLMAKMKRAKLVYDVRDIWPDVALEMNSFQKGSIFELLFRFVRNFMLKRSDLITAVSPGKVKKLEGYPHKAPVELISNGFDLEFLENVEDEEVIKKYDLNPETDCIYVGKLGLAQGLSQLLELAKRAQEQKFTARFLLFGIGVEQEALRQYIDDHQLTNVLLCGGIPHSQIYTVLKNARMSFVPLVNEQLTDSVPTKMYEALGVGCPVLLAACGDSADILRQSGLGIAVTPNDSEALWTALCMMYRKAYTDEERKNASNLMRENYSRQASAERMVHEVEALFNKPEGK